MENVSTWARIGAKFGSYRNVSCVWLRFAIAQQNISSTGVYIPAVCTHEKGQVFSYIGINISFKCRGLLRPKGPFTINARRTFRFLTCFTLPPPTKMSARKTLPKWKCWLFFQIPRPPPPSKNVRPDTNCERSLSGKSSFYVQLIIQHTLWRTVVTKHLKHDSFTFYRKTFPAANPGPRSRRIFHHYLYNRSSMKCTIRGVSQDQAAEIKNLGTWIMHRSPQDEIYTRFRQNKQHLSPWLFLSNDNIT